jgi:glycerophosphoryl diester phosphodiesterase
MGHSPTGDVMILGHRGYWSGYNARDRSIPENSTGAIEAADAACIDGVELDVKMSSDGVPYILHDFNLGRTTNYSELRGLRRYNPYSDGTNSAYNPPLSSVPAREADRLRLLNPARTGWSNYTLPRLSGAIQWHNNRGFSIPLIFDVKTSDAVRATASLIRDLMYDGRRRAAIKVNATLYQTPAAFDIDAPDIQAIPVFTTNMLGKINVDNALSFWMNPSNGTRAIEVNVKSSYGLLYREKDLVIQSGRRAGVFHALADENKSNGNFFLNTGACCYKLSDIYFRWKPGFEDTSDRRGDLNFINGERFGFITTDDPNGAAKFFAGKGKRRHHPTNFE